MDQIDIRRIQLRELDMLKEIDKICQRHNLTYFALGGTLLGAVRHHGFIPWDDDLDIAFKRADYELFMKTAEEELPAPYRVINHKNDPDHIYAYGRVIDPRVKLIREKTRNQTIQSLWVDVFPLDTAPGYGLKKILWEKEFYILRGLRNLACFSELVNLDKEYHGLKKFIVNLALKTNIEDRFDIHKSVLRLDRFLVSKSENNDTRIGNPLGAWWYKELFPKQWFEDVTRLPFEDIKINCPKEYDAVLTQMYGDYMTPPPVSERKGHGASILSWK